MKALGPALAAALLVAAAPLLAGPPGDDGGAAPAVAALPPILRDVDIEEHLGLAIDRRLTFTDARGHAAPLSTYFDGKRPVLLVLAYYRCPMLCGLVLRGAVEGLSQLDYELGDQYRALTVSFDPSDTPYAAFQKQTSTLAALHAEDRAASWPFLVGDASESRALAGALGFRFARDPATDQYAHPAALFVLTPDGRISRYLYGVRYSARDLRLALLEASDGKIGTIVDRTLLTCYQYDPATRRYAPYIFGFFRIGGALILATVVTLLAVLWRRERAVRASARAGGDARGGPPR